MIESENRTVRLKAGTYRVEAEVQDGLFTPAPQRVTLDGPKSVVLTYQPRGFIPAPGAAVGTGDGTVLGTVYVSPVAEEVEVMRLVNEVRTQGTLNGADAIRGSCVEGEFKPGTLRPLSFNGLYAYAARKHAVYMSEVAYEGHAQTKTDSPYFYGATVRDRVVRAYKEQAGLEKSYVGDNNVIDGGENAASGYKTPEEVMRAWMQSEGHCMNIMYPHHKMMSAGVAFRTYKSVPDIKYPLWAIILGEDVR